MGQLFQKKLRTTVHRFTVIFQQYIKLISSKPFKRLTTWGGVSG